MINNEWVAYIALEILNRKKIALENKSENIHNFVRSVY